MGPYMCCNHMTWMQDYQNQRLEEFAEKHFKNYDIICFQEMFSGIFENRTKLAKRLAKKHGLIYAANSPVPCFNFLPPFINGGHMMLSRFPIVENEFSGFNFVQQATH